MTYALREAGEYAAQPLPAQTAWLIAVHALIPLGFRSPSFHDPFHAYTRWTLFAALLPVWERCSA